MLSTIPSEWMMDPPQTLVVGDGPYASALALVLGRGQMGAGQITCDSLVAGLEPNKGGGYPRALEHLERVFLVFGTSQSAADVLCCHKALWTWVEKLSSAADQHELAIVIVFPPTVTPDFEEALALGLCVPAINPASTGHAVAHMDDPLESLVNMAGSILPMDLLPLRARRAADERHTVLAELRAATTPAALQTSAGRVLEVFQDCEYHLDLFCFPPSHQHGNLLRNWLNKIVTDSVTQEDCNDVESKLAKWLANP